MPSTEDLARMADDSYEREKFKPPEPYDVVRVVESPTGYRGVIYRHRFEKGYVVAHTGTEFDVDKIRDVALTDAQMVLLKANQQLDDARATVELALAYAKKDGTQVTVTGHSLGGFHTEVTCYEYELTGETFNGYGAAGLYAVPAGGSQVINHVRATDMVGAANRHFGTTHVYATASDLDALFSDGRPPSQNSALDLVKDVSRMNPDKTHGAVQFHDGARKQEELEVYGPSSIITAENQIRYQQHKAEFDAYREDIRLAAQALATAVKSTGAGAVYSAGIGAQHVQHKIRNSVLGNEVLDEIRLLHQAERAEVDERNRHFTLPATPQIYRDGDARPLQQIRDRASQLLREPTLQDNECKPPPGSGWPQSASKPLTMRDDPLEYMNRMIAVYDGGDMDTFRQMTQEAAKDPFAQRVQAQGAAIVDREEHLLAEQQQLQQEAIAVHGPRLGR